MCRAIYVLLALIFTIQLGAVIGTPAITAFMTLYASGGLTGVTSYLHHFLQPGCSDGVKVMYVSVTVCMLTLVACGVWYAKECCNL